MFVTDADNREVLEYDGTGGAIQRWYAYGLGPNDVLNQMNVVAGTRATLLPDILGSEIASLDSGTGALTKVGYLPYGKSAGTGPFGYTGQRVDVEMGGPRSKRWKILGAELPSGRTPRGRPATVETHSG